MFIIGFMGFGWFFDIIMILLGRFRDQYGNYLVEW